MHHRMPRSSRPRSQRRHGRSVPRRTGVLLALALTMAVAAGGALLLAGPVAGMPTMASFALDTTSQEASATQSAQQSGRQKATQPAIAAGSTTAAAHRAVTAGGAAADDPMGTLRKLAAAGSVPGPAADGVGAQPTAKGEILPDGGKKDEGKKDGGKKDGAAPAPNPNCTLVVPKSPTSARGLTTPYELTATSRRAGACHEADADQSAFVEAAILDTDTGALSTYRPLVIDAGDRPAQRPVPVRIPTHAAVAVWFGFNGDTLTLAGPGAGSCVNGLPGSPFGQFAYCDAPAFFDAANAAIAAGMLTVPDVGTGKDGLPCPTTRDFSVVDQDQSDNLTTTYRIISGRMAQDTPQTQGGAPLSNGSDEGLLAAHIDPALGCTPFTAPDQTNGGAPTPALALNELSAAAHQASGMALIPSSDPMALLEGKESVDKTNLYRAGVDQPPLPAGQTADEYCANLLRVAPVRLYRDAAYLEKAASPAGDGTTLLQFLVTRLQTSVGNLGCLPVG